MQKTTKSPLGKDDPKSTQNNIARVDNRHGPTPLAYDLKIATMFCERIAQGKSMRTVCQDTDMPAASTIFKWLADETNGFNTLYGQACDARADAHAEELTDIADDGTNDWMEDDYQKGRTPGWQLNGENIQRSKLRINTRQWLMGKQKPKKYGEKLELENSGEITHKYEELTDEELDRAIKAREDRLSQPD